MQEEGRQLLVEIGGVGSQRGSGVGVTGERLSGCHAHRALGIVEQVDKRREHGLVDPPGQGAQRGGGRGPHGLLVRRSQLDRHARGALGIALGQTAQAGGSLGSHLAVEIAGGHTQVGRRGRGTLDGHHAQGSRTGAAGTHITLLEGAHQRRHDGRGAGLADLAQRLDDEAA